MAPMTGMTVGAIVVGNTLVCKPAEDTILSLAMIFEIFAEAGLPPGVVNDVPGTGRDFGSYLVAHPKTRLINFTGSLTTGAQINESTSKLAEGQRWSTRVFLELGGKDAILVDETSNFDDAGQSFSRRSVCWARSARPARA
jgi:1-pyrroline-5-carboxylate dehydrogenase